MGLTLFGKICAASCAMFIILTSNSALAGPFNSDPVKHSVVKMLKAEQFGELADSAFDAMFKRAAKELKDRGYDADADQMTAEWEGTYHGMLSGRVGDTGDHAPIYVWIDTWYFKIEAILTVEVCDFLHVSDIYWLNHSLPVVLDANQNSVWCVDQLRTHPEDQCRDEYNRSFTGTKWQREGDPYATNRLHFGAAPIFVWWAVEIGCESATFGTDGSLLCGAIATAAEISVARYVAPSLGLKIYDRRNLEENP